MNEKQHPASTPRLLASMLADHASAGAILAAALVVLAGMVWLAVGLVGAFMDGYLKSAAVPIGGAIALLGMVALIPAILFRRAHHKAVSDYRRMNEQ